MTKYRNWLEEFESEFGYDPEYLAELLVLEVNGAIRKRMRELDVTQEDLAERLGVTQARVSRLLNYNKNLTIRLMARIASALEAEWTGIDLRPREQTAPGFPLDVEIDGDAENVQVSDDESDITFAA